MARKEVMAELRCLEDDMIAALEERIARAEARMVDEVSKSLYAGGEYFTPPTPEELRRYKRDERIRKLLRPYYWLRWRIVGTWNVWRHGQCNGCEEMP